MNDIHMVDLQAQYKNIKPEIDKAIQGVLDSSQYISGSIIFEFEERLSEYLGGDFVITCANGTDALQIALMALELKSGDEVIVPDFSYAATVEVIVLLGLTPVFAPVELDSFNIDLNKIEALITPSCKAIIPVHLFGQQANMEGIMQLAKKHDLYVIEDNAQSIGSKNNSNNNRSSLGHISTTSFFPSKNLGCYGDGGAIYTGDQHLAEKIRMISNHGQSSKYIHDIIGVNSRLDSIQAAILLTKLKYLDEYIAARKNAAKKYDELLSSSNHLYVPYRSAYSDHCYHQYTLRIKGNRRNQLSEFLKERKIPHAIYYPLPLHQQKAYSTYHDRDTDLGNSKQLCNEVISIPMHSELTTAQIEYIATQIVKFLDYRNK